MQVPTDAASLKGNDEPRLGSLMITLPTFNLKNSSSALRIIKVAWDLSQYVLEQKGNVDAAADSDVAARLKGLNPRP